MKKHFLISGESIDSVLQELSSRFGLPTIRCLLDIYYVNGEDILEVSFSDGVCFTRYYGDSARKTQVLKIADYNSLPPIHIENRNIKYFLGNLYSLGLNEAVISLIKRVEFMVGDKQIFIQINTISGDMLSCEEDVFGGIQDILIGSNTSEIEIQDIDKKIKRGQIKTTKVFDNLGTVNPDLKDYMDKFGIEHTLNRSSIQSRLSAKSNDYLPYNDVYEVITGENIYSMESIKSHKIKPISIIIPTYNSENTIQKVLLSIQSQDLSKEDLSSIEVIVVDDGSNITVASYLTDSQYAFDLKVVRCEKNMGRSRVRNIGGFLAKHEHLLFIDADTLLSKNFISEHSARLQLLPKAIFISLKLNIFAGDTRLNESVIAQGLPVPENYNDKRLFRKSTKDTVNLLPVSADGYYEYLGDTSYFAKFGHGRIINGYDLPSLVITHNMSVPKKLFSILGGFSTEFKGWGLEDTYFGACAIAEGYFVIPVLSAGVYHVDHPPRSLSEQKKLKEYQNNIDIYLELINRFI
jgi:glycosyltransferase involved in cell wall biosynthesis